MGLDLFEEFGAERERQGTASDEATEKNDTSGSSLPRNIFPVPYLSTESTESTFSVDLVDVLDRPDAIALQGESSIMTCAFCRSVALRH